MQMFSGLTPGLLIPSFPLQIPGEHKRIWLKSMSSHSLLLLRLLVDTVMHFPQSLEEVTVTVSDERMWVRNHVEEEGNISYHLTVTAVPVSL